MLFTDMLLKCYILLIPFVAFLPRLPLVNANPIRLIGMGLWMAAILDIIKNSPTKYRIRALLCTIYLIFILHLVLSALNHSAFAAINEAFPVISFLATLVILSSPSHDFDTEKLLKVIVLSSICAGFFAIGIYLKIIFAPSWKLELSSVLAYERTAWAIDNVVSVLGQLACLLLILTSQKNSLRSLGFFGLPISWINILLGQFRAYIVLSLFLIVGILVSNRLISLKKLTIVGFIFCTVGFLAYVDPMGRVSAVLDRFSKTSLAGQSYIARENERILEISLIRSRPWWGHGFGISRQLTVRHITSKGLNVVPAYGHNLYTSFAARIGIPSTMLFVGVWGLLGCLCWKASTSAIDEYDKLLHWSGMLLILGVLMVGPVGNLMGVTYSAPVFAIFIAPALHEKAKSCT